MFFKFDLNLEVVMGKVWLIRLNINLKIVYGENFINKVKINNKIIRKNIYFICILKI